MSIMKHIRRFLAYGTIAAIPTFIVGYNMGYDSANIENTVVYLDKPDSVYQVVDDKPRTLEELFSE